MKVVTLDEFLQYPKGTLFRKFTPERGDELCMLHQALPDSNDFTYSDISDPIREYKNWNKLHADYDRVSRDGCFELEQLFIVYDQKDVRELIETLEFHCIDRTKI